MYILWICILNIDNPFAVLVLVLEPQVLDKHCMINGQSHKTGHPIFKKKIQNFDLIKSHIWRHLAKFFQCAYPWKGRFILQKKKTLKTAAKLTNKWCQYSPWNQCALVRYSVAWQKQTKKHHTLCRNGRPPSNFAFRHNIFVPFLPPKLFQIWPVLTWAMGLRKCTRNLSHRSFCL